MGTWLDEVRVATAGSNVTLSGAQTIDGVALAPGDAVLAKDQATLSENGTYTVSTGTWTRRDNSITPEATVRVSEGVTNAHSEWYLWNQGIITLGSTGLIFYPVQPPNAGWKQGVRAATTANITLMTTQTVDGVVLNSGDRVLVKDQTVGSQNGIWIVIAGAGWVRASDANTSALMTPELSVRVSEGAINAHTEWGLATQSPITLETTGLQFVQTQRNNGLVVTKTVDGASPTISAGTAVVLKGAFVTQATVAAIATAGGIAGIAVIGGAPGGTTTIVVSGPVDPAILSLGPGVTCAVGLNASAVPVRVTDATCVTGLKYVGFCDGSGTIFVSPRTDDVYHLEDWGGAINDSSSSARTNNTAAFIAIQAVLANNAGAEIHARAGDWYFAADPRSGFGDVAIHLYKPVRVQGDGGRFNPSTVFHIPDGLTGLKAWHNSMATPVGTATGSPGGSIRGILVQGEGYSSINAHGIDIRCSEYEVYGCVVSGMGGHGYAINLGGSFADNWSLDWCRATACQDGIHIEAGSEGSNGVAFKCDVQENRGWGIYDNSFLGCHFISLHCASNKMGAYYSVAAAGVSDWVGCYAEEDQLPSSFGPNSWLLGGLQANGRTPDWTGFGGYSPRQLNGAQFLGAPHINPVSSSGTNPPRIALLGDLTASTINLRIEVTTAGYPGGYDSFSNPQTPLVIRYSLDGGSTWTSNVSPPRADNNYAWGVSKVLLGSTNVYACFVPYLYSLDNVYTTFGSGGHTTYFQAGSVNGTTSAYGWGHETPVAGDDAYAWTFQYNAATGRWRTLAAGVFVADELSGSVSLPQPGARSSRAWWGGSDTLGWSRVSWFDGSHTPGDTVWQASMGYPPQWYHAGDLLLNRSTTSIWPRAYVTTRQGGWASSAYGANTNWATGLSMRVGDTIRPSTPNGRIYRAQPGGVTGASEPTWPTAGVGNTVTDNVGALQITWTDVGVEGSPFEPFGSESETMYLYDCSTGGSLTPPLASVNAKMLKLTGSPGADFSIVIPAGPAGAWSRTIWNATGKTATVKASSGDIGVAVPTVTAYQILSDGTNAVRVQ